MIPGIVAAQLLNSGVGVVDNPSPVEGASVVIDLINDLFWLNGDRDVAELLDGDYTREPDGSIEYTNGAGNYTFATAAVIGAFNAARALGYTMLIEWEGSPLNGPVMVASDTPLFGDSSDTFVIEEFNSFVEAYDTRTPSTGGADFHGDSGEEIEGTDDINVLALTVDWVLPANVAGTGIEPPDRTAGNWLSAIAVNGSPQKSGADDNNAAPSHGFGPTFWTHSQDSDFFTVAGLQFFNIDEGVWILSNPPTSTTKLRKIILWPFAISHEWVTRLSATGEMPTEPVADGSELVLDCPFDGVDGATTAPDNSPSGHTLTFVGNAQLDTAQKQAGTASLLLDGTGDYVTVPFSTGGDFDLDRDVFEIDLYVRLTSVATNRVFLICKGTGTNQFQWALWYSASSEGPVFTYTHNGNVASNAENLVSGQLLSINTWYRITVSRNSEGIMRIYIDGVFKAKQITKTDFIENGFDLYIGRDDADLSASAMIGWIDELKIRRGAVTFNTE